MNPDLPLAGDNVKLSLDGHVLKFVQNFSLNLEAGKSLACVSFSLMADVKIVYKEKVNA